MGRGFGTSFWWEMYWKEIEAFMGSLALEPTSSPKPGKREAGVTVPGQVAPLPPLSLSSCPMRVNPCRGAS